MNATLSQQMEALGPRDHICLLYEHATEYLAAIASYIKQGLERQERCVHISDEYSIDEIVDALAEEGIDVESERNRGALVLLTKRDAPLRSGALDSHATVAFWEESQEQALNAGFSGLRVIEDRSEALGPEPGNERIMEYERLLNTFLTDSHSLAICAYHLRRFPSDMVTEMLSTHPIVVMGNDVLPNLYIAPSNTEENGAAWMVAALKRIRLAENNLRDNEERLKFILEASQLGSWELDLVTDTSKRSLGHDQIFGYESPLPEWNYSIFLRHVLPEDRDHVDESFRTAQEDHRNWHFECRIKRADSEVRWIEANGKPIADASGKVTSYLGTVVDITDRKQAEAQLRRHTEALSALHEINTSLAAERDLEKIVQSVTDAGTQLSGAGFGAFFYNVENEQGESYLLYTLSGVPKDAFDHLPMPRNTSLFGSTFRGENIIRLDDVTKDPRYGKNPPHYGMPKEHPLQVRSFLAAPVISRSGEVIGGLFFGHSEAGVFAEEAEQLVAGIAAQAAVAIDNARLYNSVQESEEQFRGTFENAAVGIAHVDLDGRWIRANQVFSDILGYSREELLKKNLQDVTHPDDIQSNVDQFDSLIRGEINVSQVERRYRHREGHTVWANLTVSLQRDVEGNPLYQIFILEEISQRKRIEQRLAVEYAVTQALANSQTFEEALLQVLKSISSSLKMEAVAVWMPGNSDELICSEFYAADDFEGADSFREVSYNTTFKAGQGLPGRIYQSRKPAWVMDVTNDPNFPRASAAARFGLRTGIGFPILIGEECVGVVEMFSYEKLLPDEFLKEMMAAIGQDIGQFVQQEKAENALRRSEEQRRLALEAAQVGTFDRNLVTGEEHWSEDFRTIFGLSSDDSAAEDKFYALMHRDDETQVRQLIEDACSPSSPGQFAVEYRVILPDDNIRWVASRARIHFEGEGNQHRAVRMVGTVIDITERKQWEETLEHANQMLERRVSERTAELERQTLRLRLLANELTETEQRERRRLAEIIHDHLQQLLVGAKIQVNSAHLRMKEVQDRSALALAVSLLDQAISESRSLTTQLRPPALYESGLISALTWLAGWVEQTHSLKIDLHLDQSAEPDIENGAVLLFESVRELLLNVVKYAEVDECHVSLKKVGGNQLCLTVEDNGKGFDPDGIHRSNDEKGGFGLFSIRERMRVMGGECEIRSAPGTGTAVFLFSPLNERTAPVFEQGVATMTMQPTAPAGESARIPSTAAIKVVIADDHSIVREGLAGIIENAPDMAVVAKVGDGQAALEAAHSIKPDVIVMDVNMPEMNGIEATKAIRAAAHGVRVIGLSIHTDEATMKAMLDAGATAYLAKDGPTDKLLASIRDCVKASTDK